MTYLAIALGGALGAMSRYWVYSAFLKMSESRFPYATLTVNMVGSFLLGVAFVLITERLEIGPELRGLITIGFLGAFTTFSTFSMDTLGLIEQGLITSAITYVLSSVLVCIIAAWFGLSMSRYFF